ncbi:response regulator of the LytR/AlgR family [Aequorivita sublithincola DSM 14238]|uniref:Response regulator of the LytR/AlgR family n=1 Tax=Aequorivita sublithincola (strain DSM 14238 / LMG 21431 / ACAM 643 / 9-3) TaxID=746697 RepID=I3Z024_AEQSU|nr:response regulator of the LytR/AlgR family [Aequorivita sublithincola DSM 14238]
MIHTIFRKKSFYNISSGSTKTIGILLVVFISIVGLTIFQDFLESIRSGSFFYFSESILFKSIWFLFIPILGVLSIILKNQNLYTFGKTISLILAPIFIHLALLTFVFIFLSVLFYNGRYDIYKILTYTLANDLYKLVLVYSIFVIAHRYLSYRITDIVSLDNKSYISKIIIGNGKNNTVVKVNDIYQITAETPYISIQLNDKKYLHTETLKSMSTQLDNKVFVRVHKSSIINLDKVVSLKSRLNGDYDITLKNGAEIRLSRNYVADFKSKLKLTHQVTT